MQNQTSVTRALDALSTGGMVVVADDADRENEGDLVCAAEQMTHEQMVFFLRHGSGIVCVSMTDDRADELNLPLMQVDNTESQRTAFTVTIDHASVSTGISAADRLATIKAVGHRATRPQDLRRPGHVFPLRSRPGGVLKRAGHTEAASDLVSMAGCSGEGVLTELVDSNGVPLAGARLRQFAARHHLPYLEIADLIRYRQRTDPLVLRTGEARLPTDFGDFRAVSYKSVRGHVEHLALVFGDVAAGSVKEAGVLVRVHSECLTGDVFSSQRCDCGSQLTDALRLVAGNGAGVVVYLRGHEGRGIGLGHKLRAYELQDGGRDTVDANLDLGLPVDSREYGVGAAILQDLGVRRLRLITNNPDKYGGLSGYDLEIVERVTLKPTVTANNLAYLTTKRDRLGHQLDLPTVAG